MINAHGAAEGLATPQTHKKKVGGSHHALLSLYRPFGIYWLDSCLQETLLPNSPWHKLEKSLCAEWARRIRQALDSSERRQMVFEIVGHEFVHTYFADLPNDPLVLESPNMSVDVRELLRTDALSFLNHQLIRAAEELGLSSAHLEDVLPHNSEEEGSSRKPSSMSTELIRFLEETTDRIRTGLDRHLLLSDKGIYGSNKLPTTVGSDRLHELPSPSLATAVTAVDRRADQTLDRTLDGTADQTLDGDTTAGADTKKHVGFKGPATPYLPGSGRTFDQVMPHNCWSHESEVIGLSLRAILERNPSRLASLGKRLSGKLLPSTLRAFVWSEVLFQKHIGSSSLTQRKVLREKFGRGITRVMIELKLHKASKTPINGLIENNVVEVYDQTPGLYAYNALPQLKECVQALNILYCYNKTYEPHLVLWLYPLQVALREFREEEEHAFNLAFYLDLLISSCYFNWPEIHAISQRVMKRLEEADAEFYDHLKAIARIDTEDFQMKEFVVHFLEVERKKAEQSFPEQNQKKRKSPREKGSDELSGFSKEQLSDPMIFVRKWIGEGFVSILDSQAILLVWDQLMIKWWDRRVAEDFSLLLLFLLRKSLMKAENYHEMKHVLLDFPCELYTKDIQRAWIHLQREGDPAEIPQINKLEK